jgi:hypothetical protein
MTRDAHKAGRVGTFTRAAAYARPALADGPKPADPEVSHAY